MPFRNTPATWGWPHRLLHWAIAAIILFQLGVGYWMVNLLETSADGILARNEWTQVHKSWGFVIFALALVRVGWRWANPVPRLPEHMGRPSRLLAEGAHVALYVLMFALPLSGWLMASASPLNDADAYPVQIRNMVFGLFELPDPIAPGDKALAATLAEIHEYAAWGLAIILAAHVAGALKHQILDRDGLLSRMVTGARLRS